MKIGCRSMLFLSHNIQQDVRTESRQNINFIMSSPENVDRNTDKYNEDATNANHGKHPVVEYSNIWNKDNDKYSYTINEYLGNNESLCLLLDLYSVCFLEDDYWWWQEHTWLAVEMGGGWTVEDSQVGKNNDQTHRMHEPQTSRKAHIQQHGTYIHLEKDEEFKYWLWKLISRFHVLSKKSHLLSTLRPSDRWQKTSPSLTTHWNW